MVARGLASGEGSAHCRGHGGNYTVTKKLFFSVICSRPPGGAKGGSKLEPSRLGAVITEACSPRAGGQPGQEH